MGPCWWIACGAPQKGHPEKSYDVGIVADTTFEAVLSSLLELTAVTA
jgi:hypothetical protein